MTEPKEYIYLEFSPGTDIKEAAKKATLTAIIRQIPVKFDFNGERFTVHRDTLSSDLELLYHARLEEKTRQRKEKEKENAKT